VTERGPAVTGKKLARNVTVAGKTYGPKDDVPPDVLAQIKNPKAFVPQGETAPGDDYSDRDGGTAGGAKLAGPVTVGGTTYGVNDFIPDDVARQIRNPKAWEGGKLPARAEDRTPEPETAGAGGTDPGVDPKAPRKSAPPAAKRS
jgi:hypothetical protein